MTNTTVLSDTTEDQIRTKQLVTEGTLMGAAIVAGTILLGYLAVKL